MGQPLVFCILDLGLAMIGQSDIYRIHVFVDYWNFQLGIGGIEYKVNWRILGEWLVRKASERADIPPNSYIFSGMNVYTSYDPSSGNRSHYNWVKNFLEKLSGVTAHCLERQTRWAPQCHSCKYLVERCPGCGGSMAGTTEKGVDILLATDLIRMAWEDAYDIAVLVTSDSDLVPCVEYLGQTPKRVIQARFAPNGAAIAGVCEASFDLTYSKQELLRT